MKFCRSCKNINFTKSTVHTFKDVGLDPGCAMCGYIFRLMGYSPVDNLDGQRIYLWEPDEHLELRLNRRTKSVRVQIKGSSDVKLRLRLCATYGVERCLNVDVDAVKDDLPGRLISAHADTRECYDVARSWLERCTRTHGTACQTPDDAPLPTRLIHIPPQLDQPLRIVTTQGMKGKYVTLSYVWGLGTTLNTTRENLESRQEEGFLASDLPKTLRDSVEITRRLGYEWIWIDALCILQGDLDDWTHESVLMASVYGNAVFTISADVAEDTDDGILHPRRLMRSPAFGPNEEFCFQKLEGKWESIIEQPVYRRGWAFQERILSKRVLHFLRDQLAFECNTTVYREGFHGHETHFKDHFAKVLFSPYFHSKPSPLIGTALLAQLGAWNSMVQELAVRTFTRPTDRLAGISGIANALQTPELGEYFAGVWGANPFLSMFWYTRESQNPPAKYRSPSWSWEWTTGQLMWASGPCGAVEDDGWKEWSERFEPRLVGRDVKLKTAQKKGNVRNGTSITVVGFCREVLVEEVDGEYDDWGICIDYSRNEKGMYVHPDQRADGCGYRAMFGSDGEVQDGKKKYLCLQIARDRKAKEANPKVHGLMLEELGKGGKCYRRVGMVFFDFEGGNEEGWEKRTLKLV